MRVSYRLCLSVSFFVRLSLYPLICLYLCLYLCLSALDCLFIITSSSLVSSQENCWENKFFRGRSNRFDICVCLSVCLFQSVCFSMCLSVCLSVYDHHRCGIFHCSAMYHWHSMMTQFQSLFSQYSTIFTQATPTSARTSKVYFLCRVRSSVGLCMF